MTDDDLEQRLRTHYRAIDPGVAPRGLGVRIADGLDRRRSRSAFIGRTRPVFVFAVAAVLIVAVGLGLGLGPNWFLASPGVSPALAPSAQLSQASPKASAPSPGASSSPGPGASPSPSATPTAAVLLPSGSLPPVTTGAWKGLDLQAIEGGPIKATSVVAWSGGYLALGLPNDQGQLPAWISRDGRTWVTLPADTFGAAIAGLAAPCIDEILVAAQSATGDTTLWRSIDGASWISNPAPRMRFGGSGSLAGGPGGAVAILDGSPYRIAFSADCRSWQTASLPGKALLSAQAIAALGSGFVAVGDAGASTGSAVTTPPVAWWSSDGLHWTRATVQAHPGSFEAVWAGRDGLAAYSTSGGTPGQASFWTSATGTSWTISTANPLGVCQPADPGICLDGSAAGWVTGDGTRLLGYGSHATGPTEYWVSFDATHWTRLALTGDAAAVLGNQVRPSADRPFLLRDGVLFSGAQGSWFGSAGK